jgi:hypothetical protein
MSLARSTRASRRRRGRSTRPSPPAAPVRTKRPKSGTGDAGALEGEDTFVIVGERRTRAIGGSPLALGCLSSYNWPANLPAA